MRAQAPPLGAAQAGGAPDGGPAGAQNGLMNAANDPVVRRADDGSAPRPRISPRPATPSSPPSTASCTGWRDAKLRVPGRAASVSPTTLLHEAYLDMSQRDSLAFPDRGRFLAYAARAMRAVAIDRARAEGAQKRGGGLDITSLDTETAENVADPGMLSEIGAALDELATLEPALANVVDLKFFCGFAVAEIAALQGVSERTVQRQWEKARLLLYRALGAGS